MFDIHTKSINSIDPAQTNLDFPWNQGKFTPQTTGLGVRLREGAIIWLDRWPVFDLFIFFRGNFCRKWGQPGQILRVKNLGILRKKNAAWLLPEMEETSLWKFLGLPPISHLQIADCGFGPHLFLQNEV